MEGSGPFMRANYGFKASALSLMPQYNLGCDLLAIDAATTAAVRADREARFFTICSSYAPILNQRREISR